MKHASTTKVQLSELELSPSSISVDATLAEAVDMFQADLGLRLLPVVDAAMSPVGAIFDRDVRKLLLNPYGHALLRNRSYSKDLRDHVRDCPIMDAGNDIGAIVDHYHRCSGREGMILTNNRKLAAVISNRRLLVLSAEREYRSSLDRLARAERIADAAFHFEMDVGAMAEQLVELSNNVQRLAESTARRASVAGSEATSVSSAAVQTRSSLTYLAERGRGLSSAFERIERIVASNRVIAAATAARVKNGGERARQLLEAARSIDSVMTMIGDIAGTVNLLSLNATIEAARAGDAGRGFAVVAGEIRKLSDQAHAATQLIDAEVNALRSGIEAVAADYAQITETIDALAAGATEIDQAVIKEADTTRLIARSVADAGDASITIERAISGIGSAVNSASTNAQQLDQMALELRRGASALGTSVSAFLGEVRAA